MQKVSPTLHKALGVYLPLITTNCAILGIAILNIDYKYNLVETIVHSQRRHRALRWPWSCWPESAKNLKSTMFQMPLPVFPSPSSPLGSWPWLSLASSFRGG